MLISQAAARLTVRDVERAFATPRTADALPMDAVRQQLDAQSAVAESEVSAMVESRHDAVTVGMAYL